jgi:hypothetical protein
MPTIEDLERSYRSLGSEVAVYSEIALLDLSTGFVALGLIMAGFVTGLLG